MITVDATTIQAGSAIVQAVSAVVMVRLTIALARATKAYAEDSKRMADIMARDHELRVAPLLDFELGAMRSVSGWETATVPVIIRNLGTYPIVIEDASVEFRAGPSGSLITVQSPITVGAVEPGTPRVSKVVIPLRETPDAERSGPNAGGGRVTFRIRYTVKGISGTVVPGCSQELVL